MAARKVCGRCHICGTDGPLSFEHVPPHSAFNDQPVIAATLEAAMKNGPGRICHGKVQQRGMGQHTLCRSCNSMTGSLYVPEFAEWCRQAMAVPVACDQSVVTIQWSNLRPLVVAKELVAMFLSVLPAKFSRSPLPSFVLDMHTRGLHSDYRLFVYRIRSETFRWVPLATRVRDHQAIWMSEISFPPLGYLMTIKGESPDPRLVDITAFADHSFDHTQDFRADLAILETHLPLPGDYRTKAEILSANRGEP